MISLVPRLLHRKTVEDLEPGYEAINDRTVNIFWSTDVAT